MSNGDHKGEIVFSKNKEYLMHGNIAIDDLGQQHGINEPKFFADHFQLKYTDNNEVTQQTIRANAYANFKFIRKQLGLNINDMAAKLEINYKSYAAIEEGRALTEIQVYKLSRLININMETIYLTDMSKI